MKICPIQTHTYSTSVYDEIILREIRFPCGKIIFKTHDRSDLLYRGDEIPQALSEMLVINNECDTVKHIEFQMGYYNDRSASPLDRRLRLDRIVEMVKRSGSSLTILEVCRLKTLWRLIIGGIIIRST